MITSAEGPGLEAGRAQLLQYRGVARVETGDPDGVSDMRTAAEILARLAHERTPVALVNLADTVRGLGDMATADAAYGSAAEWARRFALTMLVAFVGTEQAYQAYHAGDWQTSRRLLTAMSATDRYTQSGILITKARIDLAENRVGDALSAARKITDHAIGSGNEEFFYYGVALEARSHHAAGRPGPALEACDRFANRWIEIGGTTGRAIELCEIAPILAGAARADTVRDAATLLPEACRWREALLLTAEGRYADAAALYIEIGSRPLAADTHLLAAQQAAANGSITDAAHYLDAVRDFADTTGANLYRRQAELLTTASA
jgi:hypothetical protein